MCFRETLRVNINGVCSKENCAHYLEVRNKANITDLSHPALTSVSPACLLFISFLSCHNKKMHFPSLLMQRAHRRISWKIRRPGSTCCRRLKLLWEGMKKPFFCGTRNSHVWYIKALDSWKKDGPSLKYVIVFQTWRRSREQELTMEINSISLPEPWSVILLY